MYCPKCGQERVSDATSFCSRCGYLLTGTAELLETGGVPLVPTRQPDIASPRSRGIKQGLFMFLLTFVLAPLVGIISVFALGLEPWPVGVVVLLLGFGGLLRIAYALMFESRNPPELRSGASLYVAEGQIAGLETSARPPSSFVAPASVPTARRLVTRDLGPPSVTESTTRLLEIDDRK